MCDGTDKSFVVINQKGIDPFSLDVFAKEGIIGLRYAVLNMLEGVHKNMFYLNTITLREEKW